MIGFRPINLSLYIRFSNSLKDRCASKLMKSALLEYINKASLLSVNGNADKHKIAFQTMMGSSE